MINFGVNPKKERELLEKMKKLGISEKDIIEKFIHSRGKGGQNVNKVSTCVYLKHIPTGIEIKCQQERHQALNRFLARRMLTKKIEEMILGRESEIQKEIYRIRRQKRKRTKRAQLKVLEKKRRQSEKKQERSFKPEIEG